MFGLSTVRLIALAVAAAAILSFVGLAFHWRDNMTVRGKELANICAATRTAADQPKLDCKLVTQQISLLGQNIATLKQGINAQNQKITAMGIESARQAQELAAAKKVADQRAVGASNISERLAASSKAPERIAKPCEPSKTLQDAWH